MMVANIALTDEQRFPLLTDAGRDMLRRLREHPHGPRFNHPSGERLTATGLGRVRAYANQVQADRLGWWVGGLPPWLPTFVAFCLREVPFYRRRRQGSDEFLTLPTINRTHLRREPWAFVPDSADLTDLIVYTTSGTTGERLHILSHPEVSNRYLPLIQAALAAHGIFLEGGARVSILQVGAQLRTFTMATVMSYLDFAGYAKINLNPDNWRDSGDRVRFLDDCNPELYTGDPFAFAELMKLPLTTRPKALLSSATTLLPGLQQRLETHFGCPVIDVYSLNESGPVAFSQGGGHEVLPPDLYVEILDPEGRPCPAGTRGEITLSGGNNPYLPLLRYRTGDFAALAFSGPMPRLVGLEGRLPTLFRTRAGRLFSSIDISSVLRDLPLPFFALHQGAGGSLRFRTCCDAPTRLAAESALRSLFGADQPLAVEMFPDPHSWNGKTVQYTSDVSHDH